MNYYSHKNLLVFLCIIFISSIVVLIIKRAKIAFIFVFITMLGIFLGKSSLPAKEPDLFLFSNNNPNIYATAEVKEIKKKYSKVTGYIINLETVKSDNSSEKAKKDTTYKEFYKECNKNKSNAIIYLSTELKVGDKIELYGKLKNIKLRRNPTDFNSYAYYRSLNIEYKITPKWVKYLGHNDNLNSKFKSCREYFASNFENILPHDEATVLTSIILGDRSELDTETYNIFKTGGVSHIVAISGLHISIISLMIMWLLKRLSIKLAYIITILFLVLYAIFSGLSPSVIRAVTMTGFLIIISFMGRKYDILSSVSLACIIMLSYNCYYIYNIGFCYSFACVFSIGLMIEIFNKYKIHKILQTILISFAANIASKPITVYSFYYVYLWDILSNILIVPFMSIFIIIGIISNIISIFSIPLAKMIVKIDSYLISAYKFICQNVSSIPHYEIKTAGKTIYTLIAIYVLMVIIYNCFINIKNIKYI
ncbi:MAG: ComEC/Rec2 family competence protein, partial [Lachnospirales bacterium]